MRRRRSASCSSGILTRKGRIALSWVAASAAAGKRLAAATAAELARKSRRLSDDDVADMIFLSSWTSELQPPVLPADALASRRCSSLTWRTLTPRRQKPPVMRCEMLLGIARSADFLGATFEIEGKFTGIRVLLA